MKTILISGHFPQAGESDSYLLDLLKSAQEEREELVRKLEELSSVVCSLDSECYSCQDALEVQRLKALATEDRCQLLQSKLDTTEQVAVQLRDEMTDHLAELTRLHALLDDERSKVVHHYVPVCSAPFVLVSVCVSVAQL